MRRRSLKLMLVALLFFGPFSASAQNATKEFTTATTYGVLAGTLVGAASLAFTEHPGENLQRVARGASIGLYLGIMLGVYIVYIVPGKEDELQELEIPTEASIMPRLYPIIGKTGIDGLHAQWNVFNF